MFVYMCVCVGGGGGSIPPTEDSIKPILPVRKRLVIYIYLIFSDENMSLYPIF